MSYLRQPLGDDDPAGVYARCPRCSVCANLGVEAQRGGMVFCSNCARRSPVTEWYPCSVRELDDASTVSVPPLIRGGYPARLPVAPVVASAPVRPPAPARYGDGLIRVPMVIVIGVLAGFIFGGRAARRAW